jgi:hypothetical protein
VFGGASELGPDRAATVHFRQPFGSADGRGPKRPAARQIGDHDVIHMEDAAFVEVGSKLECKQGENITGRILDRHHAPWPVRRAGR